MPLRNGKQLSAIPGLYVRSRDKIHDAVIELDAVNTAPTTSTGHYYLYTNGTNIYWNNGSSAVALNGGSGTVPSWETLYAADASFDMTATGWTITQSGAAMVLTLTKTNTSSGSPFIINNAGTGDDIQIVNTDTGTTGAIISTDFQTASPADDDVMLTLEVNGFDDGGGANEYANVKFIATDVSAGTEDAKITINEMVGGTSRTVLDLKNSGLILGYGSNVTITSQGAYDLILSTNEGTNSGTITITDGAAGAIALAPDTTGVVTISTGLQVGGTTATASIFNVAGTGGGGTTGYGFKVNATTLTTGTAFLVDSASTSSGLLLDLQLASSSVFKVSETGATVIAGAAGATVFTITAGDVLLSDASLSITDADSAVTVSVTNNTATTTNVIEVTGNALTSGYLLNLTTSAAGLTSGGYINCYDGAANDFSVGLYGATVIAGNAGSTVLTITNGDVSFADTSIALTDADNAATLTVTNSTATSESVVVLVGAGVYTGTTTKSWMTLTNAGLTSGTAIYIAEAALTTGKVLDITATAATDGVLINVTGGGANMSATGGIATFDLGAATVGAGLRITTSGVYTGAGLIQVTANSATTGVIHQITANGLTTGTALAITSTGTMTTTGELIALTANTATTCTGLLRISGTALTDGFAAEFTGGGANATASGGVLNLAAGAATDGSALKITTSGVYTGTVGVVDINAASATTGVIVDIGAAGLTSGTAIKVTATEATLTTGKYLIFYDGAANDFSVARYGATVIAGNAIGTAALTLTNGDVLISSGNETLTAGHHIYGTQAIVNANTAISVVYEVTTIANNGGSTHTMADGVAGQHKWIFCTVYAADAVITPDNLANGSTITFNAVGDGCEMIFTGTEWWVVNLYGTAALA